eukprot:4264663-Alexandrium_andersonii.AAC.1
MAPRRVRATVGKSVPVDDEDLRRKAAMEQVEVARLASPQQQRRATSARSRHAAAPRIGSSAAA